MKQHERKDCRVLQCNCMLEWVNTLTCRLIHLWCVICMFLDRCSNAMICVCHSSTLLSLDSHRNIAIRVFEKRSPLVIIQCSSFIKFSAIPVFKNFIKIKSSGLGKNAANQYTVNSAKVESLRTEEIASTWRKFHLCGGKPIENKDKWIWIDLRLGRLFDFCEFDLGRVDCIYGFIVLEVVVAKKVRNAVWSQECHIQTICQRA